MELSRATEVNQKFKDLCEYLESKAETASSMREKLSMLNASITVSKAALKLFSDEVQAERIEVN
jgi:hypothetical protein